LFPKNHCGTASTNLGSKRALVTLYFQYRFSIEAPGWDSQQMVQELQIGGAGGPASACV